MTPDVNILVAAFRETHPQHAQARRWLTEALEGCASGAQLAILPMVAVGFVRVVTNGRVVKLAAPATQALGFLKSILLTPGAWIPDLGPEWTLFESLCL